MNAQKLRLLFGLVFITLSVFAEKALGAPFYENKLLKIVVGSEPGGGYDRMARLVAKHLPKHIPGKPRIIVEDMGAASGMVHANYMYHIAKPDGLTIGAINRGIVYGQLLKAEGVKFDIMKFSWIGSTAVEAYVFCLRADLPYKTFDDLLKAKEPIPVSGTSPGSADYQFATLLREFLGVKIKIAIYPSGTEGFLAMERKEVDGRGSSYSSFKRYIESGMARPLVRGRISEPEIENLPVDEDLTTNPLAKTIMAMRSAPDGIGRPYLAPPNVPPERMNILREAFANLSRDSEFVEDCKKVTMRAKFTPADECLKVMSYLFNQPESVLKEFNRYIKF